MDKKKILIVNDENDVMFVLQRRLAAESCSVISASNGSDGFALAKSEIPDLIILAQSSGNMLVEEVVARLRQNPVTRNIPLILIIDLFYKQQMEGSPLLRDCKIISKPYDMEKLLVLIQDLLSVQNSGNFKNSKVASQSNQKISVLVIEDERDLRGIIEYYLNRDGFEVYSAANGQDGIKMAVEKMPDVILLDWMMPGMDGLEVLSELKYKEITKEIPVFMMTGKNMMDDLSKAHASGADDYIIKPLDPVTLGKRIVNMIEALVRQR